MDKNKIFIVIILFLLMISIFIGEQKFHEKLKSKVFLYNNINELREYEYKKNNSKKISYILPKEWSSTMKYIKDSNNGLVYHNYFESKKSKIYGDVQIWNNSSDLKSLLHNTIEACNKEGDIRNYKEEEIFLDKYKGYRVTYEMGTLYEDKFFIEEYFLRVENYYIRMNFIKERCGLKERDKIIFRTIIDNIKEKI